MGIYEKTFDKADYRILILVTPVIALLLLPAALSIRLGMDFTGGSELQLVTDRGLNAAQLESALSACAPDAKAKVQQLSGKYSAIVRSRQEMTKPCVDAALASLGFSEEELSHAFPSTFKPELGRILMEQGVRIAFIAAVLVALVVIFAFRSPIPSIAVLQAALFDIIIAAGVCSLLGIELNLVGVAALLMLLGYSVDTDIVLTSKALKQSDKPFKETVNDAFLTGATMTGAALAAMGSIIVMTSFIHMDALFQIATIIFCGLVADLGTTWLTNVGLLKWYLSKPRKPMGGRFSLKLFRS